MDLVGASSIFSAFANCQSHTKTRIMPDTVTHDLFGALEVEIEDGICHLNGETAVGIGGATPLHITGREGQSTAEILKLAASAHTLFEWREEDLRDAAVRAVVTQEKVNNASEEIGEKLSMEDVVKGYSKIMIINYFTQANEVSVYFEDVEGLIGMDVILLSDLAFSTVHSGLDG